MRQPGAFDGGRGLGGKQAGKRLIVFCKEDLSLFAECQHGPHAQAVHADRNGDHAAQGRQVYFDARGAFVPANVAHAEGARGVERRLHQGFLVGVLPQGFQQARGVACEGGAGEIPLLVEQGDEREAGAQGLAGGGGHFLHCGLRIGLGGQRDARLDQFRQPLAVFRAFPGAQ